MTMARRESLRWMYVHAFAEFRFANVVERFASSRSVIASAKSSQYESDRAGREYGGAYLAT